MSRAGRLWGVLLEATLDAHGHAGLLRRLRHPGYVARLLALAGVPPERSVDALAPLLNRALKHDQERLDLELLPDRVQLSDGRFAPIFHPSATDTPALALGKDGSRAFARAPGDADDARLSAAFDLAFLPLPAPFLDLARRPRTGARMVSAIALCSEVVFAPLAPTDALANRRAARAFTTADDERFLVTIFDETLRQLERLLYRGVRHAHRVVPLQTLAQMLDDGAKAKRGAKAEALARRDVAAATLFGARALQERQGPPIFRRPSRRPPRRLGGEPALLPKTALDQGDLFAW